ncbi:MAG: hypothetical protein AAF465_10765 [Pseudomonadota bacterium]
MPLPFVVLALVMTLMAAAIIVIPVYRAASGQSWLPSAASFALLVVGGTAAAYVYLSDWNWQPFGVPDAPAAQQLYALQKAVHEDQQSATAWRDLGRFYLQFDQLALAIDSLESSVRLSGGRDVDTNLNLVEALAARGEPNDGPRSAEILSASLKLDPGHRKALWYGGEVAASLGQWEVAIARWQAMLSDSRRINSDEARSVTRLLEQRIAAAEAERDQTGMPAGHVGTMGAPEAVRIQVTLEPALSSTPSLRPSTNVFVFVRPAGEGGPPIAVHRATLGQLPLDIVLDDRNAMMPSRTLSGFEALDIVARVSLGGVPTATPGDLFGEQSLGPNDNRHVSIRITEVVR